VFFYKLQEDFELQQLLRIKFTGIYPKRDIGWAVTQKSSYNKRDTDEAPPAFGHQADNDNSQTGCQPENSVRIAYVFFHFSIPCS
jgi:hypothetical protein